MASAQTGSPIFRRVLWLAAAILVALLAYIAGWYYFADKLQSETDKMLSAIRADGGTADCGRRRVTGFPFRIGLNCDTVHYKTPAGDVDLQAGAFRSAAQIYDPTTVVGELDGPLKAEVPGLVPMVMEWELMHASVRLAQPLPTALSVEGRDVTTTYADKEPLFTAQNAQIHMRTADNDVDLAWRFAGLRLTGMGHSPDTPELTAEANLTVVDGLTLAQSPEAMELGYKTRIRQMTLSFGPDVSIGISGPLAVDPSGLIDAELTLTAQKPVEIARFLATMFPDQRDEIEMVAQGLTLLGNAPTLPLRIAKGRASIAFITLGDIPPLKP